MINWVSLKRRFPAFWRSVFLVRDAIKNIPARLRLSALRKHEDELAVSYLSGNFPRSPASRSKFVHGGAVKLTYLAETFPHRFPSANLLYAVSSVGHPLYLTVLSEARRKGLKVVINQNGVSLPAWDGEDHKKYNLTLKEALTYADFIIYQSNFCRISADRYISPPDVPHEIIYNPVDTRLFSPEACQPRPQTLTLLLGGNQYEKRRLELALQILKALHRDIPDAKLIVTGNLWLPHDEAKAWTKQALHDMKLSEHVTFTGTYAQTDAPALYSQAHLLLHTKYADPSPGLILEAMALGMPVVHLDNGGVPELVGEAGIGVHVEHDWNKINLPDPQTMADAVVQVYSRREEFSQKARQRAVELFSLEKFIARHREIFEKVLSS